MSLAWRQRLPNISGKLSRKDLRTRTRASAVVQVRWPMAPSVVFKASRIAAQLSTSVWSQSNRIARGLGGGVFTPAPPAPP